MLSDFKIKLSAFFAAIISVFLGFDFPHTSTFQGKRQVGCAFDVPSESNGDKITVSNRSDSGAYFFHNVYGILAVVFCCATAIYRYSMKSENNVSYLSTDFVRNYIIVGLNKKGGANKKEDVVTFFAKNFNAEGIGGFTVSDVQGFWRSRFNLKKLLETPVTLNPSLVIFVDGPKEQTAKIVNIIKRFLEPKNGYGQLCVLHTVEPLLKSELIYIDKTEKMY